MGEILEVGQVPLVFDSTPVFGKPMEFDRLHIDADFDKCLATLIEMGYDVDVAHSAIRECGKTDVPAVVEYMDSNRGEAASESASSTAPSQAAEVALDFSSSVMSMISEASSSRASSSRHINGILPIENGKQHISAEIQPDSSDEDNDEARLAVVKGKEKSCLEELEDLEKEMTARWAKDDDPCPGTDKKSYLMEMGFKMEQILDAIKSEGESADVTDLANYIMNETFGPLATTKLREDSSETDIDDMDLPPSTENGKVLEPPTEVERRISSVLNGMGLSVALRKVSHAIKTCGSKASIEEIVDFLLAAEIREQNGAKSDDEEVGQDQTPLQQLQGMGHSYAACLRAIQNNPGADICELVDYIAAEELAGEDHPRDVLEDYRDAKRRRMAPPKSIKEKKGKERVKEKSRVIETDEEGFLEDEDYGEAEPTYHRNTTGFGLPGQPVIPRMLSPEVQGSPYFYFENVASTPKGEWENITRHLYNIQPEFVDSLNFSACRRPRGYVHNLPIEGRVELQPRPPLTIQELFPRYAKYWPHWDDRRKLNTINTKLGTDFIRRRLPTPPELFDPSPELQKVVMKIAKQWNLVWIFRGMLAPLHPEDMEKSLGFEVGHTRPIFNPTERTKALGNSFQINTVAFHLSAMKPEFSQGIRVLSLFSGIGGAEVALHRLGIPLKVVVSVEIDERCRDVLNTWWVDTEQKGRLFHAVNDVKELKYNAIANYVREFGGFDLVIGGSPCNNLSGNNRHTRHGLQGTASIAFFEFPRILNEVKECMIRSRRQYWM